jgi:cold shock CspA family protein
MSYHVDKDKYLDARIEGIIIRLIPEKKAGWIKVLHENQDFYFVKNQLIGIIFEHLSVGDQVQFIPYRSPDIDLSFANKIILSKPIVHKDERLIGCISRIFEDQNYGFIEVDDNNADRYFKAEELTNKEFANLKVGERVSFIERISKQNSRFANKIIVIDSSNDEHEDNSNFTSITSRYQGYVKSIIKEKQSGWIFLEEQNEDIYFVSKQLKNVEYKNVKINDKVTFDIGLSHDGKKFANKILIISYENENNVVQKSTEPLIEKIEIDPVLDLISQQIIQVFSNIQRITNPFEFENSVFLLLRSLGIHSLYQYDSKNQAGRGDGFFIIGNLAVMYDCTLREQFEDFKKDQIENYVNKIDQSQISFELKKPNGSTYTKTVKIAGKNRQVWIITKGKSREISDYGNVKVKEIGINDLIWLFNIRIRSSVIEEEDLSSNFLSCLEKIDFKKSS